MAVEDLPQAPAPLRASEPLPTTPGFEVRDVAVQLPSVLASLPALHSTSHQLQTAELTALVRDLLAVMQLCESAAAALTRDAIERGVVHESTAAGATQWVARLAAGERLDDLMGGPSDTRTSGPLLPLAETHDEPRSGGDGDHQPDHDGDLRVGASADEHRPCVPGIEPAHASRIAKVAVACRERRNHVLATALAAGRVGPAAARTALIEVEKVMPVLPTASRDDVFSAFLALPPGANGRAIRELSRRVIATYADEDFLRHADERLDSAESVTWGDLPNGMVRLVADLAPLHAAQLRHAIDALSSPTPGNECCDDVFHRHSGGSSTGEPDARTPAKRRADGLVLLTTRGAALIDDDGSVPTTGQAQLIVTLDFDTLAGAFQGFGTTSSGTALDAHLVRRLACDAEILPMVLGSEGQPLDVGREQRLVTKALRAAVVQRDRHCTFPGCDRAPTWCHVHHVVPWFAGGETTLDNSALLCPRHHTIVHRDGYLASTSSTGVTWDLTPGRLDSTGHTAA